MAGSRAAWQHSGVLRALIVITVLVTPAIALADARDLAQARAALRDGAPERAIAILERAQEESTDPEIERELYLAHHQLGDEEQAAAHLEAYLDAATDLEVGERAELEGHLRDLRAPPAGARARDDAGLRAVGWAQLAGGIAGLVVFLVGGTFAAVIENGLGEDCRNEARLCAPGERDPIDDAWTVALTGLGPGVIFLVLGAVDLAIAEEGQRGASRSLPPDLDPGVSSPRTFSLAPWVGRDAGGIAAAIAF